MRWLWFAGWAVAGACLALIVSQIGVFTFPAGVVLIVVLTWHAPRHALGFVAGVGAVGVVIGALSLDYHPCPRDGVTVLEPGQTSFECGGFDGTPWLVVGAVLVVAAMVGYALANRRSPGRSA